VRWEKKYELLDLNNLIGLAYGSKRVAYDTVVNHWQQFLLQGAKYDECLTLKIIGTLPLPHKEIYWKEDNRVRLRIVQLYFFVILQTS
jgi:hypothetical protein